MKKRTANGISTCTYCETHDQDCHTRQSKRNKPSQQNQSNGSSAGPGSQVSLARGPSDLNPPSDEDGSDPQVPQQDGLALHSDGSYSSHHRTTSFSVPSINGIRRSHDSPINSMYLQPMGNHNPITIPIPRLQSSASALSVPTGGSSTSTAKEIGDSHSGDIDTGFLQVYGPENQQIALSAAQEPKQQSVNSLPPELMEIFAETYWECCYPWCPVLDAETLDHELEISPLLANSVALAASHIRPPLVPHDGPEKYYQKAKFMFYHDEEPDTLMALKAVSLFYWWAPKSPATSQRNSSWWWSSVIIRIAQQINVHREPPEGDALRERLQLSLRRRLWWTVFVSFPMRLSFCIYIANHGIRQRQENDSRRYVRVNHA